MISSLSLNEWKGILACITIKYNHPILKKNWCISNKLGGIGDDAIFEEDGDDNELDTSAIHPYIQMKERDFKKLLEKSDNDI